MGKTLEDEATKLDLLSGRNMSYTRIICSRQLLHFTTNVTGHSRPFWVNGGLLTNKFEPELTEIIDSNPFFLRERPDMGGFWVLGFQIWACLVVPGSASLYEGLNQNETRWLFISRLQAEQELFAFQQKTSSGQSK